MSRERSFGFALATLSLLVTGSANASGSPEGNKVPYNTPKFVTTSRNLGLVEASTVIEVSVWLNPHDKAGMDALAKELYDPTSPQYRQFLSKAEWASRFAPTANEANTVAKFLTSNNLKLVKVGPDNFYVRVRGTAADISSAFRVTLSNYDVNGQTIRGNSEDPYIAGEAASLVNSVAGLDSLAYTHPLMARDSAMRSSSNNRSAAHAANAKAVTAKPALSTSSPLNPLFNPVCFPGTTSQTLTTMGSTPTATYTGNEYAPGSAGCGYTPQDIRKAYNLNALYDEKYDGTGQTIVILDWCGSPTITADANAFSAQFGLPKLTAENFTIIPTGVSYCSGPDAEINIDVEWAHAIAPGAKIALVIVPTASFQDTDEGFLYAVETQLGNNFSGSYGSEELYTDPSVLIVEDEIAETAALLGISANFATGDDGDYTFGYPAYNTASVIAPADSPYTTAVGGVSLALDGSGRIAWQSAWGNNMNVVADGGYVEDSPSGQALFNAGSGGGESSFYSKPEFQNGLPGYGRQLPDISWLADPFTGAYIAISEPFTEPEVTYQVYGGTSLACPMFSALWAIANQEAGQPLGQAAPYLYRMGRPIFDIQGHTSATNVTGVVVDSNGTTNYSAASLIETPQATRDFQSYLWNYPLDENMVYLLSFGTDSGLSVSAGWDNATGLGVPDGRSFAASFHP